MGEAVMEELSDRGSIPLSSIAQYEQGTAVRW